MLSCFLASYGSLEHKFTQKIATKGSSIDSGCKIHVKSVAAAAPGNHEAEK